MSDDNRYEREGGCAFPFIENGIGGETVIADPGMTLRDYAAIKVLAAIVASPNYDWFTSNSEEYGSRTHEAAHFAYSFADAMLAARGGQTDV